MAGELGEGDVAVIPIPEVRDYRAVNAAIVAHLGRGHKTIRLAGMRGQRLMASGLSGPWSATIVIEGDAGPELAAGLEAPELSIVCQGHAADGAASGMRSGRLVVMGPAGPAFGYALKGGLAVAAGSVGPRAGLNQAGGDIVLLGQTGALAGERQAGGRLFAIADRLGPHASRGHRGGRLVEIPSACEPAGNADASEMLRALEPVRWWLVGRIPAASPDPPAYPSSLR